MPKVVHLIPYDGIGGVETAARSMGRRMRHGDIEFEVDFIFRRVSHTKQRWSTFNPLPLLVAAKGIATDRTDLLIVSLWRAAIVGILAKLLRPKLELVVFIHCSRDVHWADFIFTRLAIHFATEVWADSNASLRERFLRLNPEKCRVISFVTRRLEALPAREVGPDFIFWGRISAQKGLDRALRIFTDVSRCNPTARFWIIGPDGGDLQAIQRLRDTLEPSGTIIFLGEMMLDEIARYARHASFYLQTSLFEGMAMSVVEAMQLGLVPVVTPVGEIGSYCSHRRNALVVESDEKIVEEILDLLNNNMKYHALCANAILTWNAKPLYTESVMRACEAILTSSQGQQ